MNDKNTEKAIDYFSSLIERLGNGDTDNKVCKTALEALRKQSRCGCPCGEPDPSFCETCNRIRVEAIREKQERDNPQPLTLEQVKERTGQPVWLEGSAGQWLILLRSWDLQAGWFKYNKFGDEMTYYLLISQIEKGTVKLYIHKPKEAE
jgi:hypothetical protein